MQFGELNLDALKRTTDVIVGPDGTAVVAKTYHAIAAAMQAAFNEGFLSGRAEAEVNVEERLDNAFDEGFEQGAAFQELEDEEDTAQTADECYDDGYLAGVDDARTRPASAEEEVMRIVNERAGEFYDQLEMVFDEA